MPLTQGEDLSWYVEHTPDDHTVGHFRGDLESLNIENAQPGFQYYYCVAPETKILTSDLRWVEAIKVSAGDELVGFDEFRQGNYGRTLKRAIVESVVIRQANRILVKFDDGSTITTSDNHLWLILDSQRTHKWGPAKVGSRVRRFCSTWEQDRSYTAGWLAGMFDGEGCAPRNKEGRSLNVTVSQKSGPIWNKLTEVLESYVDQICVARNQSGVNMAQVTGIGRIWELLGTIRPSRILTNYRWEGSSLPHGGSKTIVAIEPLDPGPVVSIQTSTRTFVAEGLASHNCNNNPNDIVRFLNAGWTPVGPDDPESYGPKRLAHWNIQHSLGTERAFQDVILMKIPLARYAEIKQQAAEYRKDALNGVVTAYKERGEERARQLHRPPGGRPLYYAGADHGQTTEEH